MTHFPIYIIKIGAIEDTLQASFKTTNFLIGIFPGFARWGAIDTNGKIGCIFIEKNL